MRIIDTLRRCALSETPRDFLIASGFVAIAFFCYAVRFPLPPFFGGDAEHYWRLGSTFFSSGSFSLLDAEQTFRGYLLPLIFGSVQALSKTMESNAFYVFYGINAIFTAVSLALAVPLFVTRIFNVNVRVWQSVLGCFLFFLFWRGYLVEPLSDTWSFFFSVIAITLLVQAARYSLPTCLAISALSGVALGAAVNIRPVFLICAPIFALGALSVGRASFRLGVLAASAIGFAIVVLPQSLINNHFLGSPNPFVHSGNLYTLQLYTGLATQRVECAYFIDPAGIEILKLAGVEVLAKQPDGSFLFTIDVSQRSVTQYARIVLERPIDAALVYVRHFVNGMTLLSSNIYQCAPSHPRVFFNLISLAVVLLALVAFYSIPPKLRARSYHTLVWIPLVPVLFSIPVAMEGRFFFPLHMASYGFLIFFLLRPPVLQSPARHWRTKVLVFITLFALSAVQLSHSWASTYLWLGATNEGILLQPLTVLLQSPE